MPDIDLEPHEYRGAPEPGQPVFKRGGLLRLGIYAGFVAAALIIGAILQPIAYGFVGWLRLTLG
jgi:hypothetical protein